MKNIHVLPTDKPSRLIQAPNDILILLIELAENNEYNLNKHIYITSNEEIKVGDWVLDTLTKKITKNKGFLKGMSDEKIILTTEQDLIDDGVQAIDDEFLEWFVKNPSCEYVELKGYAIILPGESCDCDNMCDECKEKVEEPKQFVECKCTNALQAENCNRNCGHGEEPKQELEKEMFELEQELDIPSHLRWHNSKPKLETIKEGGKINPLLMDEIGQFKFLPKQETTSEGFHRISKEFDYSEFDFVSFKIGTEWQQEQFSKSEFIQLVRATKSDAEARRIIREYFK